jgi:membrane protein implicated in regulation of membrane protease activity
MENMELWHILLALAIASLIIEVFTLGFLAGALGVGLVFASIGAAMDLSNEWLLGLFAIGSTVAFFTIRPIIEKFNKTEVKTNADSLIGLTGRVLDCDPAQGTGRAMIGGDDWKIEFEGEMAVGDKVEVTNRQSIVLTVKRIIK